MLIVLDDLVSRPQFAYERRTKTIVHKTKAELPLAKKHEQEMTNQEEGKGQIELSERVGPSFRICRLNYLKKQ